MNRIQIKVALILVATFALVADVVWLTRSQSVSEQTSTPNPGGGVESPATVVECTAREHSCPCATGNYCLPMGAMCLNPSQNCPTDPT